MYFQYTILIYSGADAELNADVDICGTYKKRSQYIIYGWSRDHQRASIKTN